MKRVSKRSFTLLELLVVIGILGLGLSLTAIKIKEIYTQQHFLTEIRQIVSHLQMAQDLMLIMDTNTEMRFGRDPEAKALYYQLKIYGPWGSRLVNDEEKHVLTAIHHLEFNGKLVRENQEIVIKFYSKGLAMTAGKLMLSATEQKDHTHDYQINLAGYPHFIESQRFQQVGRPVDVEPQLELFPKELLDLLDANQTNHT